MAAPARVKLESLSDSLLLGELARQLLQLEHLAAPLCPRQGDVTIAQRHR